MNPLLRNLLIAVFFVALLHLSVNLSRDISRAHPQNTSLDAKIEQGIIKFIEKQRQAQQKSQASRQQSTARKAVNIRPVSKTRDHIYGNPDAEISLVEYSDFECPFCKRFHPTPKKLVEKYGGKVNWVYRHFPLGFHNPLAQKEAESSECANELGGNEAFWKYADSVYKNTRSNGRGLSMEQLAPIAGEIGLNKTAFQQCLDSGKYAERVQADIREGSEIGVTGTPATIILHHKTGKVLVQSGAYPIETFTRIIESLLN